MYISLHTYTCTYLSKHTHAAISAYIHMQLPLHTYTCTYLSIHTHAHISAYIHIHLSFHTYTYTYFIIHIHAPLYLSMHIRAHIISLYAYICTYPSIYTFLPILLMGYTCNTYLPMHTFAHAPPCTLLHPFVHINTNKYKYYILF